MKNIFQFNKTNRFFFWKISRKIDTNAEFKIFSLKVYNAFLKSNTFRTIFYGDKFNPRSRSHIDKKNILKVVYFKIIISKLKRYQNSSICRHCFEIIYTLV